MAFPALHLLDLVPFVPFVLSFVPLTWTAMADARERRVPNPAVAILLGMALARLALEPERVPGAVAGLLLALGTFVPAAFAGGVGPGDAKLALALGLLLGFRGLALAVILAVILALPQMVVIVIRRKTLLAPIPYGLYLSLSAVIIIGREMLCLWGAG